MQWIPWDGRVIRPETRSHWLDPSPSRWWTVRRRLSFSYTPSSLLFPTFAHSLCRADSRHWERQFWSGQAHEMQTYRRGSGHQVHRARRQDRYGGGGGGHRWWWWSSVVVVVIGGGGGHRWWWCSSVVVVFIGGGAAHRSRSLPSRMLLLSLSCALKQDIGRSRGTLLEPWRL